MPAKSPSVSKALEKSLQKLGARLRDRRKSLGVSTIAAAEAAGMSRITLYRIERGEPSVTMGAYLSLIESLGLDFDVVDQHVQKLKVSPPKLPERILLSDYKQLKKISWQLKDRKDVTPKEALDLYERNWRHVEVKKMDSKEREFIQKLVATFGRERLLV